MDEIRILEILIANLVCTESVEGMNCEKECPLYKKCENIPNKTTPWTNAEMREIYNALSERYMHLTTKAPEEPAAKEDIPMKAREIGWREFTLLEAHNAVCTDRNKQYGEPEKSFAAIGTMWTAYLHAKGYLPPDIEITDEDAALMLAVFKVARHVTAQNPKPDTFADIAGYAACACECAMIADGSRAVIVEDWTGEEKIETRKE